MFTRIYNCVLAFSALVLLAGCNPNGEFGFAAGTGPTLSSPVRGAVMADGAVFLVAPKGYCIDKSSLKGEFALLARCDTLGSGQVAGGTQLALITATMVPMADGATPPKAAELASALAPHQIRQERDKSGLALVQAQGDTGLDGFSDTYWRGAFSVNGVLIGLALYTPQDSKITASGGASMLSSLARGTSSKTIANSTAKARVQAASLGNTN